MPRARTTDRDTSHDAAASVIKISEKKKFILKTLRRPHTDESMIEAYKRYKTAPWSSESGLRSRRAELVADGLVVIVGETKSRANRRTYIWQAKEES